MPYELPDIARLSNRLAADNSRVSRYIDRLPQRVDVLVDALRRVDVGELRRQSENLAATSDACGFDTVRYRAERVCEELLKPNNIKAIRQSVVRLIGACGGARQPQAMPSGDWQI